MKKCFFATQIAYPARFTSILIITLLSACAPVRFETFSSITSVTEFPSSQDELKSTQGAPSSDQITSTLPNEMNSERAAEAILITVPGPNTKVISPMTIEGVADPSLGNELTIRLFEYNPYGGPKLERLLAKETIDISPQTGSDGAFKVTFSYPASAPENIGWVLVSISDPEDGGLIHLTGLPLTLLASGQAEFTQPMRLEEVIQIDSPQPQKIISGTQLEVSGYSDYFFESNLGVILCRTQPVSTAQEDQLCGSSDQILSKGNATILVEEMGQPGPFRGVISFRVEEEVAARLIVFASSPRDGSLLHLSSVEVILQP